MNETVAAVLAGILLSLSAGVRVTVPLLALSLLAWKQVVTLPHDLAWLGAPVSVILLAVAFAAETIIHFVPAAGTLARSAATPLAFVAGTLLMAAPLGDHNPLLQWILAGTVGGGTALLTPSRRDRRAGRHRPGQRRLGRNLRPRLEPARTFRLGPAHVSRRHLRRGGMDRGADPAPRARLGAYRPDPEIEAALARRCFLVALMSRRITCGWLFECTYKSLSS